MTPYEATRICTSGLTPEPTWMDLIPKNSTTVQDSKTWTLRHRGSLHHRGSRPRALSLRSSLLILLEDLVEGVRACCIIVIVFLLISSVGLHSKITSFPASMARVLTMNGTVNENVLVVAGTVAAAEVTALKAHAAT